MKIYWFSTTPPDIKKPLFWFIPLALLLIAGLAFSMFTLINASHIEDSNGSDTALVTLTEADLLANRPRSVSTGSVSSNINQKLSLRINKFSGVTDVTSFTARGSRLTIHFSCALQEGNFRVLLLCEGNYVADLPVNGSDTVIIDNPNGRYSIRVAGESAKFALKCSYDIE